MIEEFLKTRTGIIMLSVIWGLGLATLFKKSCDGPGCHTIDYQGPSLADSKLVWQAGENNCYKIEPYVSACKN
jgi:hypothetical protein